MTIACQKIVEVTSKYIFTKLQSYQIYRSYISAQ